MGSAAPRPGLTGLTPGLSASFCLVLLLLLAGCAGPASPPGNPQDKPEQSAADADGPDSIGTAGGRLVISLRAEPQSLNPLAAYDNPSLSILELLHAGLVRLEPLEQRAVPALAESLEVSPDGTRYRMELRRDVRFSDGEPFDSGDVVFTYESLLNPALESPQRDTLILDGKPIEVRALGTHEVEFLLPRAHAGGETLFDGVAIVPEHLLAPKRRQGTLAEAWPSSAEASALAGLGPFRLRAYRPGERLELERNPHYWRRDSEGGALPYLDEIVVLFAPSREAELLRFEAGEIDLLEGLSADAFERLEARDGAALTLRDLGPGLVYEFLFFNLNDLEGGGGGAPGARRELERKQGALFGRRAFRQALSAAIDRRAIAELVYRGRATPVASHVSPANRRWHDPRIAPEETSLERARELLLSAGFSWRDDGRLLDGAGDPVNLTLVTNSSNSRRVETATVIQEDLRRLGVELRAVPLDFGALLDRVYETFDYEMGLLGLGRGGLDPNSALNVWLSTGDSHLWRLSQGEGPTAFERRLDALLLEQMVEIDPARREEQVDEIQRLVSEEMPFVFLVAPNVLVGARRELGNFYPVAATGGALWNADRLYWRRPGA